eukprot:360578-Chlamydomonas_euryale.AAC.18
MHHQRTWLFGVDTESMNLPPSGRCTCVADRLANSPSERPQLPGHHDSSFWEYVQPVATRHQPRHCAHHWLVHTTATNDGERLPALKELPVIVGGHTSMACMQARNPLIDCVC